MYVVCGVGLRLSVDQVTVTRTGANQALPQRVARTYDRASKSHAAGWLRACSKIELNLPRDGGKSPFWSRANC